MKKTTTAVMTAMFLTGMLEDIGVTSLETIPLKKFGGGASARFDVSYSYTYCHPNLEYAGKQRVACTSVRVRCGGAPAHSESRNMRVFQHNLET